MRVALICEEAVGARTLQLLLRGRHELAALVTSPGSPAWTLAQKLRVSAVPAARARTPAFGDDMARLGAELLLNVHSLYVLPASVLRAPAHGAYNLHPGPLPDYAGLNAPSWAIYNGEEEHGVTLHRMEPGIDTGPIAFQARFAISPQDTGLSLSLRCAEIGLKLIDRLLSADLSTLALVPQDLRHRRYFGRGVPHAGRIDWSSSARRIEAFVRACDYHPFPSPWGAPVAGLDGEPVSVLKVALSRERCTAAPGTIRRDGTRTFVATGDEWLELRRTAALEQRKSGGTAPALTP